MYREIYQKYAEFSKCLTDNALVKRIENVEKLIDNDEFNKSVYMDDAIEMLEAYKDECVRRIKHNIRIVSSFGNVV